MAFSEATERLIRLAGWYPGRMTDVTSYKKALKERGYPDLKFVSDFLSEFGGLHISIPSTKPGSSDDKFHFDVQTAVGGVTAERVEYYAERIGLPLAVVGEASKGHQTLVMDERGRMFAGYDDILLEVGQSVQEAIECLCSKSPKVPVPYLPDEM